MEALITFKGRMLTQKEQELQERDARKGSLAADTSSSSASSSSGSEESSEVSSD